MLMKKNYSHILFACSFSNAVLQIVFLSVEGDCCCNPLSLGALQKLIEKHVTGIYVHSIMIGDNVAEVFYSVVTSKW